MSWIRRIPPRALFGMVVIATVCALVFFYLVLGWYISLGGVF